MDALESSFRAILGERRITEPPADSAGRAFAGVPEGTTEKVLHGTAAALYGIQ